MTESIADRKLCIISNISFQPNIYTTLSTAAWIIQITNIEGIYHGVLLSPRKTDEEFTTFWLELMGFLYVLITLLVICIHHDVHGVMVEAKWDGETAVNVPYSNSNSHPVLCPDADIRRDIFWVHHRLEHNHSITLLWICFEGHMGNDMEY